MESLQNITFTHRYWILLLPLVLMAADIITGWIQATINGMYEAIFSLRPEPQEVLIDAVPLDRLPMPSESIIKGDAKSASIAAASIIAKVTRDRLMDEYDKVYPEYGFAQHKGYGTAQHIEALKKYGPCPIHRRSFEPVRSLSYDFDGI